MPLFAFIFFSFRMQLHLQLLPFLFNCSHKTLRDVEIALEVFPLFFFRLYFPAINKCVHENWYFRMHELLYLMILWSRIFNYKRTYVDATHVNWKRHPEKLCCNHFLGRYASQTLYYRISFYIGLVLRLFYSSRAMCHLVGTTRHDKQRIVMYRWCSLYDFSFSFTFGCLCY